MTTAAALPASPETLKGLHGLAQLVAMVFSSLALGWPILTLVTEALGQSRGDTSLRRLAAWLARRTPGVVTLAVVASAPVLLLSVARYGEAVLPAAQHMGWFWLALFPLLTVAWGATFWVALRRRGTEPSTLRPFLPDIVESYILAFRRRGLERPGLVLTVIAIVALLGAGFVLSAHEIAVLNPRLWGAEAGVPSGSLLPLRDPQLLPRLLHGLAVAMGVSGFSVAWHGARRANSGETAYGNKAMRFGLSWFGAATAAQVACGGWLLISLELPAGFESEFTGGSRSYTAVAWLNAVTGVLAVVLAWTAVSARRPLPGLWAAALALLVQAATTVVLRERAREILVDLPMKLPAAGFAPTQGLDVVFAGTAAAVAAAIAYLLWASTVNRP